MGRHVMCKHNILGLDERFKLKSLARGKYLARTRTGASWSKTVLRLHHSWNKDTYLFKRAVREIEPVRK